MTDLELPLGPLVVVEHDADLSLPERYAAWKAANEWVIDALLWLAGDEIKRGAKRISMDYLCHVLRWHYGRRFVGGEEYALNNSYVAFLARDCIDADPRLAGYIRTRRQTAA